MSKMISEGSKAPLFSLMRDGGEKIDIKKIKDKFIVLYFYPKDDTSGCTKEALSFTEHHEAFLELGAVVIGISPDSVASHDKFVKKYDLSIPLASDESKEVAESYGVWVEKSMYGKKYMGVERSTFLIDPKGKIARIWRKVKVPGHVEEVLQAVKDLS